MTESTTVFWMGKITEEARAEQRHADAELVRAAGCNCGGRQFAHNPTSTRHFEDCPLALADAIEAGAALRAVGIEPEGE